MADEKLWYHKFLSYDTTLKNVVRATVYDLKSKYVTNCTYTYIHRNIFRYDLGYTVPFYDKTFLSY